MTTAEAKRIAGEAVEKAVENGKPLLYRLPNSAEYKRIEISGTIHMREQEKCDILKYTDSPGLMTIGFMTIFGGEAVTIALNAYDVIIAKYGENADFAQVFDYEFPDGNEVNSQVKNSR